MRYLITALSVLVLAACSETIILSKPGGETIAQGILKPRFNPPHRLTVILDGKSYEGDVDSKEMDINMDALRKRYGATSKHYQAILSGLNTTHHVHHYTGVLKSPDGATLTCDYMSSDGDGGTLGTCDDGKGQIYEVHRKLFTERK